MHNTRAIELYFVHQCTFSYNNRFVIPCQLIIMVTFPPNPINSMGHIGDHNNDRSIAYKARYLFDRPNKQRSKKIRKTVYIVLASDNLVKIGHSSNVKNRIKALKILHPSFKLLGTISTKTEREVHNVFSPFRVSGEWFRYDDSMIDFIKISQ